MPISQTGPDDPKISRANTCGCRRVVLSFFVIAKRAKPCICGWPSFVVTKVDKPKKNALLSENVGVKGDSVKPVRQMSKLVLDLYVAHVHVWGRKGAKTHKE